MNQVQKAAGHLIEKHGHKVLNVIDKAISESRIEKQTKFYQDVRETITGGFPGFELSHHDQFEINMEQLK